MTLARPTQSLPPLSELFASYGRFAWRALKRHGVPERDLDDAVQEVFLVLHRRRDDVYADTRVETWIYGVCVRLASGYRQRAHVRREHMVEEPGAVQGALTAERVSTPQHQAEARQQLQKLQQVLQSLPAGTREVFLLYEVEQLNLRETAAALGIPEGTATSRLYAARRRVSQAFDEAAGTEEKIA